MYSIFQNSYFVGVLLRFTRARGNPAQKWKGTDRSWFVQAGS